MVYGENSQKAHRPTENLLLLLGTQITGAVAAQYSLCFLSKVVGKNEFFNLLF